MVEKKNNYFGHKRKEMYFIFKTNLNKGTHPLGLDVGIREMGEINVACFLKGYLYYKSRKGENFWIVIEIEP